MSCSTSNRTGVHSLASRPRTLLSCTAILATHCASTVGPARTDASADQGSDAALAVSDADAGAPAPLAGEVVTLTYTSAGHTSQMFTVQLGPLSLTPGALPPGTLTVGSCSYFPPPPPIPTPLPGDGGTPSAEPSAGSITLSDATSNSQVGTYNYRNGNYTSIPMTFPSAVWSPGDTLVVSGSGDQLGAFRVSAPALSAPTMQLPLSFMHTEPLTITWQPDSNADTISISLSDGRGAIVACSVPDARGTVTMDASLFAAFRSPERLQGSAWRETDRYAHGSTGTIVFRAEGAEFVSLMME